MTTENTRADALTKQIDAAMALAHRWATATYHKGLSKPYEDFDEIRKQLRISLRELAASPVEQPAVALIPDAELGAFVRKSIESLVDSPKSFLASVQRAIEDQAIHDPQPSPSPADERAAFDEYVVEGFYPPPRSLPAGKREWKVWAGGFKTLKGAQAAKVNAAHLFDEGFQLRIVGYKKEVIE